MSVSAVHGVGDGDSESIMGGDCSGCVSVAVSVVKVLSLVAVEVVSSEYL